MSPSRTQAALLDATIDSLVELGYAGTTTRGVGERAGVSQGAQQHHYPSKAALVEAAVAQLERQIAEAVLADAPITGTPRERIASLVDRLWQLHNTPPMAAAFEFITAARTDPEIARAVVRLLDQAIDIAVEIAARVIPEAARVAGLRDWLGITMATVRGAAQITALPQATGVVPDWPTMREHILRTADTLLSE